MSTPLLSRRPQPTWHTLCQAALFETDRGKIEYRITEAEKAILARVKELFVVTDDHIEEDQVLEDTLYGLRVLRNCVFAQVSAAWSTAARSLGHTKVLLRVRLAGWRGGSFCGAVFLRNPTKVAIRSSTPRRAIEMVSKARPEF
jgi:hypothetical protein